MDCRFILPILVGLLPIVVAENLRATGCTAIAIDGRGSADKAAYAGMNVDCANCDGRLAYIPRGEHKEGAMRPLYIIAGSAPRFIGYGRGKFYEPKHGETLSPKLGEVPQVNSTFAYWEATLPMMNEKGLALGESSCASLLLNYPKGQAPTGGDPRTGKPATEGMLDLTNMMQIALERCETARCGVKTMGALAEEYGFFPMVGEWSLGKQADGTIAFDDGGESVTLADRTGEAWIFHVVGGWHGVAKSAWAAMRIPKGHAAFVANNFVLRNVPQKQEPDGDWLFSSTIRDVARAAGLWNGKEPLDFARVFAPDTVTFESPAGEAPIPLYASLRLWRLFGLAAPSKFANSRLPLDPLEFSVTVEVEKPLAHQDVFAFLSDIYEGTEFDLTQGILAGPFGNPFRLEGGEATLQVGQIPRGISIARTTLSIIGQCRQEDEPVMWIAPDSPVTSVYVPFYPAAGDEHASAYSTGTLQKFDRESAFWAHDFVTNWISLQNWKNASGQYVLPLRSQIHKEIAEEMPKVEAKAKKEGVHVLAKWQKEVQKHVVHRWWQLAEELIAVYNDGFYNDLKTNRMGLSLGYPKWWVEAIGFNQDVHPIFVKRDENPEATCASAPERCPPGFRTQVSGLPLKYNFDQSEWLMPIESKTLMSRSDTVLRSGSLSDLSFQLFGLLAMLALGVVIGRSYERRRQSAVGNSYERLL